MWAEMWACGQKCGQIWAVFWAAIILLNRPIVELIAEPHAHPFG